MEYICECCKYSTKSNSNYHKHIRTPKHIKNLDKTTDNKCEQKKHTDTIVENTLVNTKSTQSQHTVNGESTLPTYVCKYCKQNFKFNK